MPQFPTGIVTFVFTDIEGSTSMIQRLGESSYLDVLETHNVIIRAAFHAGVEIRTEGDSFFYVFGSAADAVAAASDAQRALTNHVWPNGGEVRVRMGMHTGVGTLGGGDNVSFDVNRAARIAAAGHGGQVHVSAATKSSAGDVPMDDLGTHRFKDIVEPERVFQLALDAASAGFPPIRSLNAPKNNLPAQPNAFARSGIGGPCRSVARDPPRDNHRSGGRGQDALGDPRGVREFRRDSPTVWSTLRSTRSASRRWSRRPSWVCSASKTIPPDQLPTSSSRTWLVRPSCWSSTTSSTSSMRPTLWRSFYGHCQSYGSSSRAKPCWPSRERTRINCHPSHIPRAPSSSSIAPGPTTRRSRSRPPIGR